MLCLLSLVVLVTGMAVADTQVQFFDESQNLITGATVEVQTLEPEGGSDGQKTVLPADPDGTYDVPVEVGEKVNFRLYNGATSLSNASQVMLKIAPSQGPIPVVVTPMGSTNDLCASPQPVLIGSVTNDTTAGATLDAALFCGTSNTAPGVWFSVVGDGNTLTASTCETVGTPPGSSAYDTKISVYCQDCAAPTCVGGNDDSPGCNFHSAISWCSQAGGNYRLLVHGFGAATGAFGLSVSSNGTACTSTIDCLPPVPDGACCTTGTPPFAQNEAAVTCADNVEELDCTAGGGVYQGDDSTCIVAVNQIDIVANPAVAIPDNTPAGVNNTINVAGLLTVSDVNVDIGINHTWVSDLIIRVTGPTGLSQGLWNQVCGSTDNINATADDAGTETFCAPINSGPIDSVFYPPELAGDGPLSIFNGTQAQGDWTLNVSDNFAADFGTLNQWSLHFIEGAPICAPFECPTTGGAGGAGGTGGCPDDEDEDGGGGGGGDDDEDGHNHEFLDVEGASTGAAPVEIGFGGSGSSQQSDKGNRTGRMNDRR
jgi:subtilisin-like proprotein convertase family protein